MTISAYPLTWPEGWKRTPAGARKPGQFGKAVTRGTNSWRSRENLTVHEAVGRVLGELERMGVGRDDVIISTMLRTRMDGLPRSDQKRPEDPGAAVYFEDCGRRRCIAVDRYTTVEDNLAAIAATLDAMRAIERHGGAEILERAFTGFTALPAPGAARPWWQVLGFNAADRPDNAQITAAYRRLRSARHPDKGGSAAAFDEVERAYREATNA